jgi:hypothetical protein
MLDLPPCGAKLCRIERRNEPPAASKPRQMPLSDTVTHGNLALSFADGHLTSIQHTQSGTVWSAESGRSFLLPTVQRYGKGTWLPDWLSDEPLAVTIECLQLTDHGPIRARVTRTMACGTCRFRQHLDVYGALGEIRATTEMLLREEDVFVGIAMPVPPGARLRVDIPFGVEPRDPARVPYGEMSEVGYENIERRIPGYFWGRSWVDVSGAGGGCALVSEDADRFFWLHPSGRWLVHFCQRVIHQPDGGWEARTTVGQGVGRHVYHHVLIPHGPDVSGAELVRRADQHRHPVLCRTVRATDGGAERSWLSVSPDTVRLSAFYREGDAYVLRIYNPSERAAATEVVLPAAPKKAELVDFHLRPAAGEAKVSGRSVRLTLRPYQIATLRLAF